VREGGFSFCSSRLSRDVIVASNYDRSLRGGVGLPCSLSCPFINGRPPHYIEMRFFLMFVRLRAKKPFFLKRRKRGTWSSYLIDIPPRFCRPGAILPLVEYLLSPFGTKTFAIVLGL